MKLAAILVLLTGIAHADEAVDPEAKRVGEEANLESNAKRRGFVGGMHLGPSFTTGSTTATGGAVWFRLGQVATPNTVILFELGGATNFKRIGMELTRDSLSAMTAGVQRWLTPSLSLRFTGGLGVYACNKCKTGVGDIRDDFLRVGLAGAFSVVLDLVRFKGLVLALEGSSTNQVNREGFFSTNALLLGLSFD